MKKYEVVVIGAGSGLDIASSAASQGYKTALVEPGPLGGTCLNRGCIPSKMLIHSADVAETIDHAKTFGITPKGYRVDFSKITRRVSREVDDDAKSIEKGVKSIKNYDLYKEYAQFVGKKKIKVGGEIITGKHIFIAAGTRPSVPPIEGLDKVPYITSKEALRLDKQPKHLIIIGGGYIGCEMAHFYGGLGTKVTILQRGELLLGREDKEVAQLFTKLFSKKHDVKLNVSTTKVEKNGKIVTVHYKTKSGKAATVSGDVLLIATGRRSNADLLQVEKSGIATTQRGYVKVNKHMETNVKGVWAIGDIAGVYFFKHSANLEAQQAYINALAPKHRKKVDYFPMPHAVFTSPQIAGVGATEDELEQNNTPYAKGFYKYINTGMGAALDEQEGFVKILCDPKSRRVLGCHIIGADASTLIHEVLVCMKAKKPVDLLLDTVHIHPALPEVVQRAAGAIEW